MPEEQHMLWVEEYRPSTVAECVLPVKTQKTMQSFVDKKKMPNLMLSGPAGTGKTTLAFALCAELGYEVLKINGSSEGRLIDTFRNQIVDFASSVSFTGARKIVFIDECDSMPQDTVQKALRAFIEDYSDNCGFILTCNFPNLMLDAIHSRTTQIDFTVPQDERARMGRDMLIRVKEILTKNNVKYDVHAVAMLIKKTFPDFRKLLNDLQRYSLYGDIDEGILTDATEADILSLIDAMKAMDFNKVRKWVATTQNLELTILCRILYDKMHEFVVEDSMPQLVIDLADYQYRDSFVSDHEINIMAMLTTVMQNSEFKK
jgi:DNA polymerase III delta prime subunit